MRHNHPLLIRVRGVLDTGLVSIELLGLIVIGVATTWAIAEEIGVMLSQGNVTLADLLLMFLYLEILAMIGQYLRTGQIQVRFPLYIAVVALARYLIIDSKDITEWRLLAVSGAILFLTIAVLVLRYGHTRFPYNDQNETSERLPPDVSE